VVKGLTHDFKLFGFYADGSSRQVTSTIQWAIPVADVATITTAGRATAVNAGATPIIARVGNFTSSGMLTVIEAPTQAALPTPGSMGPQGPIGAQGLQGIQGVVGVNGHDGTQILAGSETPLDEEGKENDFFFDKTSGWLMRKIDGAWQSVTNLIGAKGDKGDQGEEGEKMDPGEKGDQGEQGLQGERGYQGFNGADGRAGNSILAGVMFPVPEDGNEKDLFFKQDTGEVYKKSDGVWEYISSLMGKKGHRGDHGEQGLQGSQGIQGTQGTQGFGGGIMAEAADTCTDGSNGGTKFTTFVDANNNGRLELFETVTSVSVVCGGLAGRDGRDGINGRDGRDGTSSKLSVSVATLAQCSAGGYLYTIDDANTNAPIAIPVCNGERGAQGLQGPPGASGTSGSSVTPVKLCSDDNTRFPEYGLKVGEDIFAVWWGHAPYTNSNTAFLAKIVPGSYRSTGGNGCNFTLAANGNIF